MSNGHIRRDYYLSWLERWRDKEVIKVVTGMRRCGKSTLLNDYAGELVASGIEAEQIVRINFESLEEQYPLEPKALYDYVVSRLPKDKPGYVFLDEVQHVEHFETAVDALFVRDNLDLYITGSNAWFLSGDLATLLSGRYVEVQLLPLSFAEYFSSSLTSDVRDDAFSSWLEYGGLPYLTQLNTDSERAEYLGGIFNTIVVKDIAIRHPRMNMIAFQSVSEYLADNIGNPTSIRRISAGLEQTRGAVSASTVSEYVGALRENYLLYRVPRYELKGRRILSSQDKYYLGDLGLRFWLLGRRAGDVGHRVENAVYLELRRRYNRVYVGRLGDSEVDFVALDQDGPSYYQVSLSVLDETTLNRELHPLKSIRDNYPKYLLTMDRIGNGSHEGILQVNLVDWLLS